MATHAPITGAPTRAPFIPAPPAAVARVLATFDRDQLSGFIAVAIDLLDLDDGDSNGDPDGEIAWVEWGEGRAVAMNACGQEDAEPDGIELLRQHRDRIRRTRCTHEPRRLVEWPLVDGNALPSGSMASDQ